MKNRFGLGEWAGALGDLGTFIPFVIGYITLVGIDPTGILFSIGFLMIGSGLFFKTPIPVQPMKAIGGAAIAAGAAVTPAMICGAGIFTGLFWLILGMSGAAKHLADLVSKPVLRGILLGLGMAFMLHGIDLMRTDILIGLLSLTAAFVLLNNRKFPAMFGLLLAGVVYSLIQDPMLLRGEWLKIEFQLPAFGLAGMTWHDLLLGAVLLGIPQIPLTYGNAIVALTAENNRLFPDRPVSQRKIMISHGIMNLLTPLFGGIPVCHGAGGLAGHARFGAKTGGSLVILGTILILLALFLSDSVIVIFAMIPPVILGVILFIAGLELALGGRDFSQEPSELAVMLVTAAFGIVNMGAGFLAGVLLDQLFRRKIIRL